MAFNDQLIFHQGSFFMKSRIVAPVILIAIGILFLLKNLGLADLDLGRLLSTWWPAILILVGISLLIKRNLPK